MVRCTQECRKNFFSVLLLEYSTDIRYIQELLVHTSTKITRIYICITNKDLKITIIPIDRIKNIIHNCYVHTGKKIN